jgi:hypothetical protein
MAAQSKISNPESKSTFGPSRPCTKRDCPLNEVGIHHSEGIYKHEGKDVKFSVVFSMSNPPPFIHKANSSFWAAQASKSAAKAGDNLEEIEKTLAKNGSLVGRFLNYHAGCKCKQHGCQHQGHGHGH